MHKTSMRGSVVVLGGERTYAEQVHWEKDPKDISRQEDLQKHGRAVACPGCRAANISSTAVGCAEECRKMISG